MLLLAQPERIRDVARMRKAVADKVGVEAFVWCDISKNYRKPSGKKGTSDASLCPSISSLSSSAASTTPVRALSSFSDKSKGASVWSYNNDSFCLCRKQLVRSMFLETVVASSVNISLRLPVSATAANVYINANYSYTVSIRPV